MSNLGSFRSAPQPGVPTPPRGISIASYATYLEAQRAVDYLSDNQFPVQHVTIVGTDLRMVERVTGRLTYGRVALAGLASGAWFGVFVGLLISIFAGGQYGAVITAALIGAGFGMLFGVISYAATRGRRDFTSTSQIVANDYQVWCVEEQAGAAMNLLRKLPGGEGRGGPGPTAPAAAPVTPAPATPATPLTEEPGAAPVEQPVPTGPTYGEMIDRRRAEERARQEREAAEAAAREHPQG